MKAVVFTSSVTGMVLVSRPRNCPLLLVSRDAEEDDGDREMGIDSDEE